MNSPTSDTVLGQKTRELAAKLGYSPNALLALAADAAHFSRWANLPNLGPQPKVLAEAEIGPDELMMWPPWSEELIASGCRLEHLRWPDGTETVRLVSSRAMVIAASIRHPNDRRAG